MKKINCILLVDDDSNENYLHTYTIKEADVCNFLKTVYNGEEALLYLEEAKKGDREENPKPDLILLDINMPGMSGFDFLNEFTMLDEKFRSGIVIAILSNSDDSKEIERAMKTKEVKEFISKPLDLEMLSRIIENHFN